MSEAIKLCSGLHNLKNRFCKPRNLVSYLQHQRKELGSAEEQPNRANGTTQSISQDVEGSPSILALFLCNFTKMEKTKKRNELMKHLMETNMCIGENYIEFRNLVYLIEDVLNNSISEDQWRDWVNKVNTAQEEAKKHI